MSACEQASWWSKVRKHAGPYKPASFTFVQEGLAHTVSRLHDRTDAAVMNAFDATSPEPPAAELHSEERHINGRQLCMGLREYAIKQYGPLARTVLAHWGVRRTEDFGKIVFALVAAGLMRKSETDSYDDFVGVFDFAEAFGDALERC